MSTEQPGEFSLSETKVRPAPVTAAAFAQFAILALALISSIMSVVVTLDIAKQLEEQLAASGAIDQATVDTMISLVQVFTFVITGIALVFAVIVAVLGIFNLRGKNGARVTTWVFAGLGLLCGMCSVASAPFSTDTNPAMSGNTDATTQALNDAMSQIAIPGWYASTGIVLNVISLLLYLAIIILLLLPKSNEFFRKPVPPVTGLPPMV